MNRGVLAASAAFSACLTCILGCSSASAEVLTGQLTHERDYFSVAGAPLGSGFQVDVTFDRPVTAYVAGMGYLSGIRYDADGNFYGHNSHSLDYSYTIESDKYSFRYDSYSSRQNHDDGGWTDFTSWWNYLTISSGETDPINYTASVARWNVVPEPVSWAMMLVGFGVLGAAARQARYRIHKQTVLA